MQVKETGFDGLVELIPTVYHDDRGWFFEFYKEPTLKLFGIDHKFPQENLSFSKKGVIRGLHFQLPTYAQIKCKMMSGLIRRYVTKSSAVRAKSLTGFAPRLSIVIL